MQHRPSSHIDLEDGQSLLDRFVLRRRLSSAGSSHLWSAHDAKLDTAVLLRIYVRLGPDDEALRDAVRRDAQRNRRVQHAAVLRVHDVHETGDMIVVACDGHDGALLDEVVSRDGALAYRRVLVALRPLVEGLLQVHELGGEHGRVDAGHVLVCDERRWILLPPDNTRPGRSDLPELGRLVATLLTGGAVPAEGRDLNDAAERLHGGRTVPALLNQLVSDLRAMDAALRPAGMRAVLDRLDQIEQFLRPEPTAPAPAPMPARSGAPPARRAPEPTPTPTRRTPVLAVGGAAIVFVLAMAGVIVLRAQDVTPPPDATAPPGETPVVTPDRTPPPDPAEAARRAAAKRGAEQALEACLAARGEADAFGADAWGGAAYLSAAQTAADADASFLAAAFADAAGGYTTAAAGFRQVTERREAALARLLEEGAAALAAPDAAAATAAFEAALMIDPAHAQARTGAQRAATLNEFHRLLASGAAHEEAGSLDFAHADYSAAATLDPHSPLAASAYERIKDRLAEAEFQSMMSAGLGAYHRGDYTEARSRLLDAQRFRPGDDVTDALRLVEEAELREEVVRLREEGRAHESREQWQDAWNTYRQVLAIDPAIEFAQVGRQRCETMIRLETHARHYLADPDLLLEPTAREDALRLVQELEATTGLGPRLTDARRRLTEHVRLATTPLSVVLHSDDETEVAVYRVGQFGTFSAKELELLPGVYTVVGQRKGYRDVRLTLRLRPGEKDVSLQVVCTERIG